MFSYLHISKVHAQIPICELGLLSCTCFTVGLGSITVELYVDAKYTTRHGILDSYHVSCTTLSWADSYELRYLH